MSYKKQWRQYLLTILRVSTLSNYYFNYYINSSLKYAAVCYTCKACYNTIEEYAIS